MSQPKRKYKPSLWWLAVAPVVFLLGVGGGTTLMLKQVLGQGGEISFVAPTTRTFEVEDPGTYVLSHDYKVTFEGMPYDKPAALPGQVSISLKGDDGEVEMADSWGSGSTSADHERQEVGRFKIAKPGSYTLSISGLAEPRVLTLAQSVIVKIVFATIACLLLNLFGWFGGPAIVIMVMATRLTNKRRFRSERPELFEEE
jgi:hypothetical protein